MIARRMTYSRFIFWLKVLLPLMALAILSTLFLVAETLDPEKAIPYAEVDVEQILQDQGISNPSFGGVTEGGAKVTIGAEAVRPTGDSRSQLKGTELNGLIILPSGTRIDVESPVGIIDADSQEATLQGGASLISSLGYRVETEVLRTAIGAVRVSTDGPITAQGPAGNLEAGRMTLEQRDESGKYLLVFKDGVRLVYRPKP